MTQPGGPEEPTDQIEQIDPPTEYFAPLMNGPRHIGPQQEYGPPPAQQTPQNIEQYNYYGGYEATASGETTPTPQTANTIKPEPKRKNGLYILVFSLVLILGLLLGIAGFVLYAGFPNQQIQAKQSSTTNVETPNLQGEQHSEPAPDERETPPEIDEPEVPPAEGANTGEVDPASGRPVHVELPPDATPANLFARNGHPNGQLFKLYTAGGASELFALHVHTEYRTKFAGFHPPKGEHYITVNDAQQGQVRLTCNDNGSYVTCTADNGAVVYIV